MLYWRGIGIKEAIDKVQNEIVDEVYASLIECGTSDKEALSNTIESHLKEIYDRAYEEIVNSHNFIWRDLT